MVKAKKQKENRLAACLRPGSKFYPVSFNSNERQKISSYFNRNFSLGKPPLLSNENIFLFQNLKI